MHARCLPLLRLITLESDLCIYLKPDFYSISLLDIYIIVLLFEVTCYYMDFEPFGFCCGGLVRVFEMGSHIAQAGLQFTMELGP